MSSKNLSREASQNGVYLGKLCRQGHEYQNSGKSLRYNSNYDCLCCIKKRERLKGVRQRIFPGKNSPTPEGVFIPDGFYLGLLCSKNHDYCSSGYTLRKLSDRSCLNCKALSRKTPEAKAKAKKWRNDNLNYSRQYFRQYYKNNRDVLIAKARGYVATPESKIRKRANVQRRRSTIRMAHRSPYTSEQIKQRFENFQNTCAYCGSTGKLTPDHFIAFGSGGSDCLGNIVCACRSCNSSKQHKDPYNWYSEQPFFDPQRWQQILKVLGKSQENYNQIPLL